VVCGRARAVGARSLGSDDDDGGAASRFPSKRCSRRQQTKLPLVALLLLLPVVVILCVVRGQLRRAAANEGMSACFASPMGMTTTLRRRGFWLRHMRTHTPQPYHPHRQDAAKDNLEDQGSKVAAVLQGGKRRQGQEGRPQGKQAQNLPTHHCLP